MNPPTTSSAPLAMRDFSALIGREELLSLVHAGVLRMAQVIRPVVESGAVLAACSDEFNSELRAAFERDVARRLTAPNVPGSRRVFALSNLGGRIEPGAMALANLHFSSLSRTQGEKLLVIEIASHVGREERESGTLWGQLDRFGTCSPCCGALQLLLDGAPGSEAVRFPWYDQLSAFFGPERLAALRADASPHRMVRAAIAHAVLQAETALVDLLRDPPDTPTQVLLVPMVVVNRRGTDSAIVVGLHHWRFEGGAARLEFGASLRSTPDALTVDASRRNLRVHSPFAAASPSASAASRPADSDSHAHHAAHARVREAARSSEVHEHLVRARGRVATLQAHDGKHGAGNALQVYARPMLRALLQALALAAPEVALAVFAVEVGGHLLHAEQRRRLLERGPSSEDARKVVRELEPMLQQLGHRQAREVLETLLAAEHPLFATGPAPSARR